MRRAENSIDSIDMFVQIVHELFQPIDSTENRQSRTAHVVLNMTLRDLNLFLQIDTALECEFGVDFSERKKTK